MENEKILTVSVEGIDVAIRSTQQLEDNFNDIQQLANKIGLNKTNEELKQMTRQLEKVVDELNQANKKVSDLESKVKNTGEKAKRLTLRSFVRDLNQAADINNSFGGGLIGGFLGGAIGGAVENALQSLWGWITAESDAQREAKALTEATKEATSALAGQQVTLDTNTAILRDNTKSTQEKELALQELQDLYPEYFNNLDLENLKMEDLTDAYNNATAAINLKIKTQVYEKLAADKLAETTQKQIALDNIKNNLDEIRNRQSTGFLSTINQLVTGTVDMYSQAIAYQSTLNEQIQQGNTEYNELLKTLTDLQNQTNKQDKQRDDATTKVKTNTEKEKVLRDAAIEGVNNLEDAQSRLIQLSLNGSEEQIEKARELVNLYKDEAIQRANAAFSVGELSGKTKQELNDQIQLSKKAKDDIFTNFNTLFDKLPLLSAYEDELFELSDKARKSIKQIVQDNIIAGKSFNDVVKELKKNDLTFIIDGSVKSMGLGITSFSELGDKVNNASNDFKDLTKSVQDAEQEIILINKQQEKAGVNVAAIQQKVKETFDIVDENYTKRQIEINEKLSEAASHIPEILQRAFEGAGVVDFETIKRNLINGYQATLDETFKEVDTTTRELIKPITDYVGKQLVGGSADEGFTIITDNTLTLAQDQFNKLKQIVDNANAQLSLANQKYQRDVANADNTAADISIKTYAEANKNKIRQNKADLETLELQFKDYYQKVLELDTNNAEERNKEQRSINEDEKNELSNHLNELLKLKQQLLEEEIALEEEQLLGSLSKQELTNEQKIIAIQEFENARKEIIIQSEKEINDIIEEYNKLYGEQLKEKAAITNEDIYNFSINFLNAIQNVVTAAFDYMDSISQKAIDSLRNSIDNIEQQISDAQNNIDALESDLEGKRAGRRDAILRGIEQEKQQQEILAQRKIELERKVAQEERKQSNRRKAAAISQALINGAISVTNLWANNTIPYPAALAFNIPMSVALTALTAFQVASIANQQFATGGYTGSSADWRTDNTGYKVAGVVHENEWVAPEWMLQNPVYGNIINDLENTRQRGFATGGYTTNVNNTYTTDYSSQVPNNMIGSILQELRQEIITSLDRPIYVTATEVTNMAANTQRKVKTVSIGG